MQDLYAKRDELENLLMQEVETYRRSGIQFAENTAAYKKAVRVETLRERAKGTPVTVTGDLVRGLDYVAELKQAVISSEAVYKSSQEYINILKIRLRIVDADIQRVWNSGGYEQ
jgi:hypothetical protein